MPAINASAATKQVLRDQLETPGAFVRFDSGQLTQEL
jgi:hypothetical protein